MLIVLFVLSFLVDWYILLDVRLLSAPSHRKRNSIIYGFSAVLCWALLIVTICLPRRSGDNDLIPIMWMLYTYLSIYIPKLVYCICSLIGRIFRKREPRSRNYGAMAGIPLAVLVFILLWWGALFTRNEIETRELEISSERIPKSFDGYRIVQFSDLHTGTWGNDTSFVSKLVDTINRLNADAIFFTGDIVNRNTNELEPFLPVLSRLKAKDGVYSVRGNHDYGDYMDWDSQAEHAANNALLGIWEKQMGWDVLDNTYRYLVRDNDSIILIGVENWGEPPFTQYGNLKDSYGRDAKGHLRDERYKILLSHNPEHWNREVRKISNIDLTLAGHTHAMQVMLKAGDWRWSPAAWRYEQWGGLYADSVSGPNPSNLYVNIGTGEVAMPSRIGAIPELTVITLRSGKK